MTLREQSSIPFIGVSVAIPLYKRYKLQRPGPVSQTQNAFKPAPSEGPRPIDGVITNEDGPIAWSYTGEAVTVYVSGNGSGYMGGYSWSGGGWYIPESIHKMDGGPGPGIITAPPIVINNARKVNKNFCESNKSIFKKMWDQSIDRTREQVCFVTDGGIF